jgi:Domain of Unknown Function with PDB structure (DUF3857)
VCVFLCTASLAQEPAAKPADTAPPSENAAATKSEEKPALPFQIQLLETHIRFEANGDSRKEVHTIVKINDLAGARQFSRLGFEYNRAFQQVEIPLVKILHANGGTSEILPSAITDTPNPAVQDFPAYHDVRVKSVRILGLQDGDTIEYRVITTTTKHPLAPNFWLEHTFDRSGQVLEERYEIDLPDSPVVIQINPATPATKINHETNEKPVRSDYFWERKFPAESSHSNVDSENSAKPDFAISTFLHWRTLSARLADSLTPGSTVPDPRKSREEQYRELASAPLVSPSILKKSMEVVGPAVDDTGKLRAIYDFVSTRIETVDLPLGATGFAVRASDEILASGYATQEDKFVLLSSMAKGVGLGTRCMLTGFSDVTASEVPRPSVFKHLIALGGGEHRWLMDPSLEVAPLGLITPVKEMHVLRLNRANNLPFADPNFPIDSSSGVWVMAPNSIPFAALQKVNVEASINAEGTLTAKLKYVTRGPNELVLRMAFHQTPKERWKEVGGLLALSDGFRGTITNVTASDPMATKDPFTVEYELTQAKFVDWSKKPVRIPALLPQIALPDAPGKDAGKIELGTPLDVQTSLTLKLPEGTAVQTPAATSVARDYATFASKYDGLQNTATVSRHIDFLKREIPSERAVDYNAFLRAVQNDQAQMLVLLPPETQQENRK